MCTLHEWVLRNIYFEIQKYHEPFSILSSILTVLKQNKTKWVTWAAKPNDVTINSMDPK